MTELFSLDIFSTPDYHYKYYSFELSTLKELQHPFGSTKAISYTFRDVTRIFQGGGVTLYQSEGTHHVVMAFDYFTPLGVRCLLKKKRGGGVTGTQGPSSYALYFMHH